MSLLKIKELSGFDVYQECNKKTNLTDFFSWRTNYLDKDLQEITFDSNDGLLFDNSMYLRTKELTFGGGPISFEIYFKIS